MTRKTHIHKLIGISKNLSIISLIVSGLLFGKFLLAAPVLYPLPVTPQFNKDDHSLNCRQLDQELAQLDPQTYSIKPGFFNDPYHGASIWAGSLWTPSAYGYLAYSGVAEYQEYQRISAAQRRIDALRRLKAHKRCYEN